LAVENPQLNLPLGAVRSKELFSSHWLQHRLRLEPEWNGQRVEAQAVLERIAELWNVQRARVAQYGAEQPLEEGFIQPVLRELGWKLSYQTYLRGREPDYALFTTDALLDSALAAGRLSADFWTYPSVVADSKAWHVSLDRPVSIDNRREYPPEQIEWYLDRSRLQYGILTNGRLWRLIPRELDSDQPRFQTYLEVDLEAILETWRREANWVRREHVLDDFLQFFLFFGPIAHIEAELPPLVVRARRGSSEYRLSVGEDLKDRVFEALRLCIDGFLHHAPNQLTVEQLTECRSQSFVFLYRLLFILYAEDRQLLPYRRNRLYTANRSLGRRREEVATQLDRVRRRIGPDFSAEATELWDDLLELFDLIDEGHRRYEVPAYNGGLFDDEQHPFLREKRLPDWYVARVIDQLSRARDPQQENERGLYSVDYRDLRIQHLGSIYERLLELHPAIDADWQINEFTGEHIEPGHVFLKTERRERRSTGSYYTPDHIVDYLVERALAPLCREVSASLNDELQSCEIRLSELDEGDPLQNELETTMRRLRSEFDDRILRLRVLDPAMGSGHFLLGACNFLAEEIATNPLTRDPAAEQLAGDESALTYWKRRVVESCLYGVDQNPLAVELAKLALWLETVAIDRPLTFLDHHFRIGNSLIGASVDGMRHLPGSAALLRASFAGEVGEQLPSLLELLREIGSVPSDTTDQVKHKERLLRQFSERLQPFFRVADLWCACFYLNVAEHPTDEQYEQALSLLRRPVLLNRLTEEVWFQRAIQAVANAPSRFFHWELEFPGVFYADANRRRDAGFDAVIGNPPYDVLSELETGQNLDALRAVIDYEPQYAPSKRGKNNLYKLFICRAAYLLREGGRLAFIVPMPLLGDDQAAGIRTLLFDSGRFTSVEAFPQKDDVNRRVFREAKLSTTAFTYQKTTDAAVMRQEFLSRTHPAQYIEDTSPRLTLSTPDIPLYDPENRALPSCSQEDWDLAIRLMSSGRMTRLGTACTSYQGEVNETNEAERNAISDNKADGPLVLRGSNVTLYMIREASQGEARYLRREPFLAGKAQASKAFHYRHRRIGFQRSSPQNNFRRIVAAPIDAGEFCFDTISYIPEHESRVAPSVLLALLNSKLLDWYFRLGSTNSKVNEYQFNNLPLPRFADPAVDDHADARRVIERIDRSEFEEAFEILRPSLNAPPFAGVVRETLVELVARIVDAERRRGPITRRQRAKLSPEAQPFQDLIDRILFALAGFTADEIERLTERLEGML
jgi:type I restriction-modification system DNA methylase subunit